MASSNPTGTQISDEYVKNFPELPSLVLARKMKKENPLIYRTVETARSAIRYRRGAMGSENNAGKTRYGKTETPPSKFSRTNPLCLPESDEKDWVPFVFDGASNILCISDIHLPYHNIKALTCALQDGLDSRVDGVLLNGDTIDCHSISRFTRDPRKRDFKGERELGVQLLERIRELFPKARIVYKEGNHEERLWAYCAQRIPEIYSDDKINKALSICSLLEMDRLGIEFVYEKRQVMAGSLPILHGHEFRSGFTPPVNPARGAYLKAKDCTLVGHSHVTSENTVTTIGRKIITTWSTGCLCELRPQYDPFNGWNHGHAIIEIGSGGAFHVANKRQLDGMVL